MIVRMICWCLSLLIVTWYWLFRPSFRQLDREYKKTILVLMKDRLVYLLESILVEKRYW